MKKIIYLIIILIIFFINIMIYINYEKEKNIKNCYETKDEKSLISCFEYPLKTANEKMNMIIIHKNFKFSSSENLNKYLKITGLIMGEYGECGMTEECKKQYINNINNFKEYLEPISKQCDLMIENECKQIKKPLE